METWKYARGDEVGAAFYNGCVASVLRQLVSSLPAGTPLSTMFMHGAMANPRRQRQ